MADTNHIRVGLYGDVNLNIIDGSAIWLQSLAETLHFDERITTTLLLKAPEERGVITEPLHRLPRLEFADRSSLGVGTEILRPGRALDALERLDAQRDFHFLVLRGFSLAKEAARRACFLGRLWIYLTDIPQSVRAMTPQVLDDLGRIATGSRYLLCQTEELRAFLEGVLPQSIGKLILLPPMIPPGENNAFPEVSKRLIYAGKFAPLWGFWDMVEIFEKLRAHHPEAELHVLGDKIHNPPEDRSYRPKVEQALRRTEGLVWHGGVTRAQVGAALTQGGIAMSIRDQRLDESLELSTKILEYGAARLPVLLNRNPMHEDLLGSGYPLLVSSTSEAVEAIDAVWSDETLYREAAERCYRASRRFTFDRIAASLEPFVERSAPAADRQGNGGRKLRLLIAGHDFKFVSAIRDYYSAFRAVEVREDRWEGHFEHDPRMSKRLADWADVVFCEWCLGNAVWYSRHKRDDQRLIIRLHRAEVDSEYPHQVDIENVDAVVCVGEHYRAQTHFLLGWPSELLKVIPNSVDVAMLDRPKLPGARFELGLLGLVPRRKRLDRALEILETVRTHDSRWRLSCKGWMPWELGWTRALEQERGWFDALFERMEGSPLLQNAVSFEPHGPDTAAWLRTVGFVLSTSDDESFHLAPAEGMAARSVPVILNWEGASYIYPDRWIHRTTAEAAESIITSANSDWHKERDEAHEYVARCYSLDRVLPMWDELILQ